MKTQQLLEEKVKSKSFRFSVKLMTIGLIILILLIPKMMIMGLIHERKMTSESAQMEVHKSWSYQQTIRGPILTIPYVEKVIDKDGKLVKEEHHEYHVLPKTLDIKGELFPKELNRSIYHSIVYESAISLNGQFEKLDLEHLPMSPEDIKWDQIRLSIAVGDLRGISSAVALKWNDQQLPFSPGMNTPTLGTNGISLILSGNNIKTMPAEFSIQLELKGSNAISFAPLGETTNVSLSSSWNDPSFQGLFLPTDRNVNEKGFTAEWKVLNYNRDFPQQWTDNAYDLKSSDFGVALVDVADHYQKNERTAKYGIMIIVFVFLSFFLNEIITKQRVHPFQYILVGFAILAFYLLLLSFSEHVGFNLAYLISAVSVIGMVFIYSRSFLKTWLSSIALTSILSVAFLFIFILLQLESFALLVGSIGLFLILGLTMFFTRRINWYE
ncbi:cell envelope integrity protein CreD [Sunxiuqinia elliptica]|uniref:Inner membrane protein n=1 Tax=Sunxiuqinia elliptica TaxID=655355 RepID=A0A4R6GUE0_9BACT|nr:cell envelope integrity protein CreD [Sunxiuqinia elliptica]TDN98255.1 inner membrane protein [Sunxiuqinia elliptica]TDO60361.1 inner membrane protein [Sunxiuqinia elliptica]